MKLDEVVSVDVDLTIAPQCEHRRHDSEPDWHGGDAKFIIQGDCSACGWRDRYLLCSPALVELRSPDVSPYCPCCGDEDGEAVVVVAVL